MIGFAVSLIAILAAAPATEPNSRLAEVREPQLLTTIASHGWTLASVEKLLPRPEVVQPIASGSRVTAYAYSGGALRVYVSEAGDILAIMAQNRAPQYRDFTTASTTARYVVDRDDRTSPSSRCDGLINHFSTR